MSHGVQVHQILQQCLSFTDDNLMHVLHYRYGVRAKVCSIELSHSRPVSRRLLWSRSTVQGVVTGRKCVIYFYLQLQAINLSDEAGFVAYSVVVLLYNARTV